MSLQWTASHTYETGVDQGVLYVFNGSAYAEGVAWVGLSSISESPSGAETTSVYADNDKYLNLVSAEEYAGTIEAYTYPDAWEACDGSASVGGTGSAAGKAKVGQQTRKTFCLCYRTRIGTENDPKAGYRLHFVFKCTASPSERQHQTVNDSPEASAMSWSFKTVAVSYDATDTTLKTSTLTVDSIGNETNYEALNTAVVNNTLFDGVTSVENVIQKIIKLANTGSAN